MTKSTHSDPTLCSPAFCHFLSATLSRVARLRSFRSRHFLSLTARRVLLLSHVCLCCFPPTLSPVITALDSSRDGKCFSTPPPHSPPHAHANTRTHKHTVSPSFAVSHQANYISVTIETCLLKALSYPPGFFFVPSLFSASTCLLFPFIPVKDWLSILSLHFTPVIVWRAVFRG